MSRHKFQYSFGEIDWLQFKINAIDFSPENCFVKVMHGFHLRQAKERMRLIEVFYNILVTDYKATMISLFQHIFNANGIYATILEKHYSILSDKSPYNSNRVIPRSQPSWTKTI